MQGHHGTPFRLNLACKSRTLSNLPEVQESLPSSTLVLSVYRQSLKHSSLVQLQVFSIESGCVTIKAELALVCIPQYAAAYTGKHVMHFYYALVHGAS